MRTMLLTLLAAALLLGAASAAQATLLYPNLKTLPPRYLRFDYTDVSADGSGVLHHVLRFSNTAYNTGDGPLEIRATINMSLNPPSGPAYQRVYDSGGGYTDIALTGSTLYYHAIHKHYHFDNWGAYQLWTKAAYDNWRSSGVGSPDLVGTKTTSCVEDEEFVTPIAAAVWPAQYPSSKCLPDANNVIAEGLSPGWGDTYDYYRSEQWIDLGTSTLPDGTYVLRSIADPDNIVYESPNKADSSRESAADNAATTTFTVTGGQILDSDPPTGTVTINHVARLTTSPNVSLDILGRDDVSGVDQFQVSNDETHWATYGNSSYDSIPQTISWDLTNATYGGTTATGTKTVYVRFHDSAGHWGPATSDTITYDPNPPPAVQTSPYGQAVQHDGPVSWWRLAETTGTTAADEEQVNPGTYVGGVTRGQPSLLAMDSGNGAAAFDGASGRVAVPDANSLDVASHLTLEAWIKPSAPLPAAGQFASILSKAESYSLQFDGPALELTIIETAGGTRHRLQAPTTIVPGDVYHVVGTYDGTTQRLYVNGQQVASQALSGAPAVTANSLYVGSWDGTKEYFHGVIDEPAVYETTLSAARVAAHYDAATQPTLTAPTGLAATPASTSAIDLSWTNTSTGETHELLERSPDASFASVTTITLPAGTHAYHDTGLVPDTSYWYRVKATTATASSPWSSAATTATLAPVTYASTVLGDHPVSYWRLDETSGSVAGDQRVANPGTFAGGPILGVPGLLATDPADTAVGFNGSSSDVRIGQAGSLNLSGALSTEAWIKPASLPPAGSRRAIFAKTGAYALELNGAQLELSVLALGTRVSVDAGTIVAGSPAYVVGTYDGATLRLYVNGAQVASRAASGVADQTLRGAHIGSWDGASELFAGTIDEVALYAGALSPAQIAAHYAQGGAMPAPPASQPPPASAPPVVTPPVVHPLRLAARVRPTHVRLRHGRVNATLVLRASARARVRLTLVSLTTGVRRGRRCVASHRRGRRCTITKALGARTITLTRSRTALALPTRYGRARLAPGRWQLLITAHHARAVRVTFLVTR
jgi:concanavalin A-like lectin/glucanase superfamily protein